MRVTTATIPAEALKVKPREAYYARQKHIFALVFITVSIVPLVILNCNASRVYRESWMEKTTLELAGMAESRRELIDMFLQTQENQLASFVDLYDPETLKQDGRLETIFRSMNRSGVITDLGVIDRNGKHLAYVGPFQKELAGRNYSDAEWFHEVMQSGRYVSDVFKGYRQVPHVIAAVADSRRSWILRATINSELFNSLVASANVGPGGDAFIINHRGELQTPSRHGHDDVNAEELALFNRLLDADQKTAEVNGRLYSVARLNGGNWMLVLETDVDSSLAEYYKARRRDAFFIGGAAVAIVLVSILLTRSMIDRLARADRQRVGLTDRVREVEKMALIGRLAASVSHEINNPLQIIRDQAGLMSELLEDAPPADPESLKEYQESIGRIRNQVSRASTITHRLLGFSHAATGDRIPVEINRALEETIALLESEARRHGILIHRQYADDLPPVRTDASQFQQVVLNLLNNAMDAMGQDGEIRVATRHENGRVNIEVADTGPGLTPDLLEQVFDPFFTTKPKGKGTGLGLYVSRNIMDRLGGELLAGNRPDGRGGLFTITLPVSDEARSPKPELAQV